MIDARNLEPDCEAIGWVSGQLRLEGEEEYGAWWSREIVPLYNDATISSLAVATGSPDAPGELADNPPGAKFRMGYFHDLDAAMHWKLPS